MEQSQKTSTRKKFLLLGATVLSAVTLSKYFKAGDKPVAIGCNEKTTVKMLAEDGSLVEIDKNLIVPSGKKITNKELQEWVKK
jgi:hypothetical protein